MANERGPFLKDRTLSPCSIQETVLASIPNKKTILKNLLFEVQLWSNQIDHAYTTQGLQWFQNKSLCKLGKAFHIIGFNPKLSRLVPLFGHY